MIIENIDIEKLIPADYNPRKNLRPGDSEYENLKRSMEEFGYVVPIIWNKQTGHVVGGHQRLKILKAQGAQEIPCVIVDLPENKEKVLNVALNKITGSFDNDKLELLLIDIKSSDIDITLTGFNDLELDKIFQDEIHEDNFDINEALQQPVFSQPGDLYLLGKHRLICGDSTQSEVYRRLMDGIKANLILTDPPYNVAYEGKAGKIQNDSMNDNDFYNFLLVSFMNMNENLANDGSVYIFHADSQGLNFRKAFSDAGFKLFETCIWKKNQLVMGRLPYHYQHEPCLYGVKQKGKHQWYSDRKQTTIWEYDKPQRSELHPTMKPIPLMAYPIKNSTMTNGIVLDPFLGSGSTLIACCETDRVCFGIELEPKFVDVIVKRYAEYTHDENIKLIRGGEQFEWLLDDLIKK